MAIVKEAAAPSKKKTLEEKVDELLAGQAELTSWVKRMVRVSKGQTA